MTDSTCPMCAEPISPSDHVCPHCGSVLREAPPPEPEPKPPTVTAAPKKATSGKMAVAIGVLVVAGGGVGAWAILHGANASGPSVSSEPAAAPNDGAGTDVPPEEAEPAGPAEPVEAAPQPEPDEETPPLESDPDEGSEVANPHAPLPEPATDCSTAPECNTRGFRYYQAKDYERALPYFSAALQRDPGHVKAAYNAACMFALLGDTDASITMLRRLGQMDDPEATKRLEKVARDGDFDRIRNEAAFQAAMRELRP